MEQFILNIIFYLLHTALKFKPQPQVGWDYEIFKRPLIKLTISSSNFVKSRKETDKLNPSFKMNVKSYKSR